MPLSLHFGIRGLKKEARDFSVSCSNPYLEYECQVVGVFLCVPRWLGTGHLDDGTAHAPHITATAILLPPEHLRQSLTFKSSKLIRTNKLSHVLINA